MITEMYDKLKELFNADNYSKTKKRAEAVVKKFTKKSSERVSNEFSKRKEQSLKDSQGGVDFSGSGYKAPGNVDHEKTSSNMSQRNFEERFLCLSNHLVMKVTANMSPMLNTM